MRQFAAFITCVALTSCAHEASQQRAPYELVENPVESAQPVAIQILRHLAAGEIDEAAKFSNAPERRAEVLREFRARVGDEEFRRIYSEYLAPKNRVIAELGLGPRRLLVWKLGSAGDRVVGQYYVLSDGRFLMDDERNPERAELSRALAKYRSSTN